MARNLQTIARDLKSVSNLIVNFTFPKISSSEESDFDFLRTATICVDGSLVNIYYTKSDYNTHFFETVPWLSIAAKRQKSLRGYWLPNQ